MRRIAVVVVVLAIASAACRRSTPTGDVLVHFGKRLVTAEVADEQPEWERGLMFREHVGKDAGMLFVFPSELGANEGFYMKNTLIPLSIAYMARLDSDRYRVVTVLDMVPCRTETCPTYDPGRPYDAALEVNRGWFGDAGVRVGSIARVAAPDAGGV